MVSMTRPIDQLGRIGLGCYTFIEFFKMMV